MSGPRQSAVPDSSRLTTPNAIGANNSRVSNSTVIFAKEIPQSSSGQSTDLKVAFLLAVVLTCFEIIIMFHKHHFYSLLAYISVFAIFFLGYFDLHYMRFVKINLLISVVLDLVWLIFNFNVNKMLLSNIGILEQKHNILLFSGDISSSCCFLLLSSWLSR